MRVGCLAPAVLVLGILAGLRPGSTAIPAGSDAASAASFELPSRNPWDRTAAPRLSGVASWYCCTAGYGEGPYAAAGPALRRALGAGWRGRWVAVDGLRVLLVDWCLCPLRLIDLEPPAFSRLAPLSRGLVEVIVSW